MEFESYLLRNMIESSIIELELELEKNTHSRSHRPLYYNLIGQGRQQ